MEKNVLFIGGVPRSGTTLLQKILNNHSLVYGGPEFDHMPAIGNLYSDMLLGVKSGRQYDYYNEKIIKNAFNIFLQSVLVNNIDTKKIIISEKTPDNVLHFEKISRVLPDAKFIFVVRDPRAILNSFQNVGRKAKRIKKSSNYGNHILYDLNRIYSSIIHGDSYSLNRNNKCYTIYYEELISNPRSTLEALCDFIEIKFEEEMLKYSNRDDITKLVQKANANELPFITELFDKPISDDSLYKWKKKLSKIDIYICNILFNRHNIRCLSRYNFENRKTDHIIFFIPLLIKVFTFTYSLFIKKFIKSIVNTTKIFFSRNNSI